MVLASSEQGSGSPKRLSSGFLITISTLMALCSKHANRVSSKLKVKPISRKYYSKETSYCASSVPPSPSPSPRSPLTARPKQLITMISNKAMNFRQKKKVAEDKDDMGFVSQEEDFGDGGVWQRAILMGDKCQPLDFSGAIYYDSTGKQLSEVPLRSPRASPLPGYLTRRQEQ